MDLDEGAWPDSEDFIKRRAGERPAQTSENQFWKGFNRFQASLDLRSETCRE